jgi:hypothetical protein
MDKGRIDAAIEILDDVLAGFRNDPDGPFDREFISGMLHDPIEDVGEVLKPGTPAMRAWDLYMMAWNDDDLLARDQSGYKRRFIQVATELHDRLVALK